MSRESAITIERLRNVYCVPPDHPAPDELRSRLDGLAQSEVIDACRRALVPLVNDADPSIWLISSIDIDVAMDAGATAASRGAAAWGEKIALAIGRTLQRGPTASVLYFADRAAYVAQWARDMAAGQAWSKWYYREFDGLRSLPQSAAIAEGIIREGDAAVPILLLLHSAQTLNSLLDVVSNNDAQRIWRAAFPASPRRSKNISRWASRLLAMWSGLAPTFQESSSRHALRFAVAALAEWPIQEAHDAEGLREAVEGLFELYRALAAAPETAKQILEAVIAEPSEHRFPPSYVPAISIDSSLREFLCDVSAGDPKWAEFAAAVIAPQPAARQAMDETFLSELGGIFLLGSSFVDLDMSLALPAAAQTCSEPTKAVAVLRHLLAVRCLGKSRAALAIRDRTVQEFSGISSNVTLPEMAEILAAADVDAALRIVAEVIEDRSGENLPEVPEEHSAYFAIGAVFHEFELDAERERLWARLSYALLRNFARRLPGFARSSPEYIFQNFLGGASQLLASNDRIEVHLAQSPLSIVLRIAGMYRTFALPWREGVEICLQAPPA